MAASFESSPGSTERTSPRHEWIKSVDALTPAESALVDQIQAARRNLKELIEGKTTLPTSDVMENTPNGKLYSGRAVSAVEKSEGIVEVEILEGQTVRGVYLQTIELVRGRNSKGASTVTNLTTSHQLEFTDDTVYYAGNLITSGNEDFEAEEPSLESEGFDELVGRMEPTPQETLEKFLADMTEARHFVSE